MTDLKTVLILGASRGLGLAMTEEWLTRGWRVIATARGPAPGLDALAARFGDRLIRETLDITARDTLDAVRRRLTLGLDVLFVNAGICTAPDKTPSEIADADYLAMVLTNALSPMRAVEVFSDLVHEGGVIAIMSSELASITNNDDAWALYASSKAALNMLAKCHAARHREAKALLLVAPGWVRTEMGGPDAALSIDESIPAVCSMVESHQGRAGLRFVNRFGQSLPW